MPNMLTSTNSSVCLQTCQQQQHACTYEHVYVSIRQKYILWDKCSHGNVLPWLTAVGAKVHKWRTGFKMVRACSGCVQILRGVLRPETYPGYTLLVLQESARGLSLCPVLRHLLHGLQPLQLLIYTLLPVKRQAQEEVTAWCFFDTQVSMDRPCIRMQR